MVIGTTLNIVWRCRLVLSLVQSARFRGLEEHLDRAGILIGIQQLQATSLDLIRNIAVTSRDVGPLPRTTAPTSTSLTKRLDLRNEPLHDRLKLAGVRSLDLLLYLALAEDDECGECGDAVLLRELLLLIVVDLDEGDGVGA